MSVTFWMPQAPKQRVQPFPEDDPDFWSNEPVPPFLDINMANDNARDFLDAFGMHKADLCGTWKPGTSRRLLIIVNDLLNSDKKALLVEPTIHDGNVTYCGRDLDYVIQRLEQFRTLFTLAIEHDFDISYG